MQHLSDLCPYCGQLIEADKSSEEQRITCPSCKVELAIAWPSKTPPRLLLLSIFLPPVALFLVGHVWLAIGFGALLISTFGAAWPVVALLTVLQVRSSFRTTDLVPASPDHVKRCPQCDQIVGIEAVKCPLCGYHLAERKAASAAGGAPFVLDRFVCTGLEDLKDLTCTRAKWIGFAGRRWKHDMGAVTIYEDSVVFSGRRGVRFTIRRPWVRAIERRRLLPGRNASDDPVVIFCANNAENPFSALVIGSALFPALPSTRDSKNRILLYRLTAWLHKADAERSPV